MGCWPECSRCIRCLRCFTLQLEATSPLLTLLVSVVAGLAQTLQVGWIPEQRLITTVRPLVVSYQLRGVRLYALAPLTLEQVAHQH